MYNYLRTRERDKLKSKAALTFFVKFSTYLHLKVLFDPRILILSQRKGTKVRQRRNGSLLYIEAEATLELDGGHATIMLKADALFERLLWVAVEHGTRGQV